MMEKVTAGAQRFGELNDRLLTDNLTSMVERTAGALKH